MALTEFDFPDLLEARRREREDDLIPELPLEVPRAQLADAFAGSPLPERPDITERDLTRMDALRPLETLSAASGLPGASGGAAGGFGVGAGGDEFERAIRQLAEFLNAPPFTESDEARRRALRFDNQQRQREVAKRQVVERLAAQGHAPSSGTVEQALQMVDQRFDAMRDVGEASLMEEAFDVGARRKKDALSTLLLIPQLRRQAEQLTLQREQIRTGQSAVAAQQQSDLMEGLGLLLGLFL